MKIISMPVIAAVAAILTGGTVRTSWAAAIDVNTTWSAGEISGLQPDENIAIRGGVTLTISIAPGDNINLSNRIIGEGAIKVVGAGGSLVLSGENSFSGGLTTSGTTDGTQQLSFFLKATSATAFGTGDVYITDGARVILQIGEIANDFFVSHNFGMIAFDHAAMQFNGDIVWNGKANEVMRLVALQDVSIHGTVNAGSMVGLLCTQEGASGTLDCFGKVTAKYVSGDRGVSFTRTDGEFGSNHGHSSWRLHAVGNDVGYYSPGRFTIHAGDANSFGNGAVLAWGYEGSDRQDLSTETCYNIGGYDQTIDRLYTGDITGLSYSESSAIGKACDTVRSTVNGSSAAAKLTMKGSTHGWTFGRIMDAISLDWAPNGNYTFIFSNRVHTTTGDLTVSAGTLRLGRATKFSEVQKVTIKAGAKFSIDTKEATSLPKVTRVKIDGTLEIVSGGNPFVNGITVADIGTAGKISVPSGTTITLAAVNTGTGMLTSGSYTKAAGWILGDGMVKIASASNTTYWNGGSADWSTSSKWTDGVPTVTKAGYIYIGGSDATVSVSAPPASPAGSLSIAGFGGKKAIVNVDSSMAFKSSIVSVGENAQLKVETKGRVSHTAPTGAADNSATFEVRDGGEVNITGPGGELILTNLIGRLAIVGAGSVTSKVTVVNGGKLGVHYGKTTGSRTGDGIEMNGNGIMSFSGSSTFELYNMLQGSSNESVPMRQNGGTILFGDTSQYLFRGSIASVFGSGLTRFSNSSHIELTGGNLVASMSPNDIGGACEVEFNNSSYITSSTGFTINHCAPGNAILRYNSDSVANFQHGLDIVHVGNGVPGVSGELWLSKGNVKASDVGLNAPALYGDGVTRAGSSANARIRQTGGVMLVNATIVKDGGTYDDNFYGARIACTPSSRTNLGELLNETATYELEDGNFTVACGVFGVGVGPATDGRVLQSGGYLCVTNREDNPVVAAHVIGAFGGIGACEISGGKAFIGANLHVGGITMDEMQGGKLTYRIPSFSAEAGNRKAKGRLSVFGGSLEVEDTLIAGEDGSGIIEVGNDGVLSAKKIDIRNSTNSVVRVVAGENGFGLIRTPELKIAEGVKLVVDLSNCDGTSGKYPIIEAGAFSGDFKEVEFIGNPELNRSSSVVRTAEGMSVRIGYSGISIRFRKRLAR